MKNTLFNSVSQETISQINRTSELLASSSLKRQKKQIAADSPYSEVINKAFSGYGEFSYLLSLGLQEAVVTRRALIRDIDFDLYITNKKQTNRELMNKGLSPYAKDDQESAIVLHHIGQSENGPFAELTATEHAQDGNSKLLHRSDEDSWRRQLEKDKAYMAERANYWKKRARLEIEIVPLRKRQVANEEKTPVENNHAADIRRAIEALFLECSAADLNYISNLAQNYLLVKEIGATSIEEFVLSLKGDGVTQITCPACGSNEIALNGRYKTGKDEKQKYKCKKCGKVFSAFYGTLIQGCTFSLFEWLRFIDCLYNGYSVKRTALLCDVSEQTVFANRLRLFYALNQLDEKVVLAGNVALDETYVAASYKGNRQLQKGFSMPREARKRGHENHIAGLSKNQACVVCAIDEYGTSIAKVAGLGAPTAERIENALKKHIDKKHLKSLYSDRAAAIRKFAENCDLPIKRCYRVSKKGKGQNTEDVRQLQRINAYHSRLKKFLEQFNGISSEMLQGYVSLFSWRDRNRDKPAIEAYKELLSVLVSTNYNITVEQISAELESTSPLNSKKKGQTRFKDDASQKRADKMYALYAAGWTMERIAKKFGFTRQAVHQQIKKYRNLGLAYMTDKEKSKEKENRIFKENELRRLEKYKVYCDKTMAILEAKESWTGTQDEFFTEMQQKYGISRQTVKNDLAVGKRIKNLRDVFYAGNKYEFLTLREVFEKVFSRFNECYDTGDFSVTEIYVLLAEEFGYKQTTVRNIVLSMKKGIDWEGKIKTRLPMAQTLNRDRSVFVDCLNWTGTKAEFIIWATQKYGISENNINKILKYNCMADPNRYEISRLD